MTILRNATSLSELTTIFAEPICFCLTFAPAERLISLEVLNAGSRSIPVINPSPPPPQLVVGNPKGVVYLDVRGNRLNSLWDRAMHLTESQVAIFLGPSVGRAARQAGAASCAPIQRVAFADKAIGVLDRLFGVTVAHAQASCTGHYMRIYTYPCGSCYKQIASYGSTSYDLGYSPYAYTGACGCLNDILCSNP